MALKTNFKDEILAVGKTSREYQVVDNNGTVIHDNVHLIRKDVPLQTGDKYGANEINDLNTQVNMKKPGDYVPTFAEIKNKPNLVVGGGINNIMALTLTEYKALVTKDPTTMYFINGN